MKGAEQKASCEHLSRLNSHRDLQWVIELIDELVRFITSMISNVEGPVVSPQQHYLAAWIFCNYTVLIYMPEEKSHNAMWGFLDQFYISLWISFIFHLG